MPRLKCLKNGLRNFWIIPNQQLLGEIIMLYQCVCWMQTLLNTNTYTALIKILGSQHQNINIMLGVYKWRFSYENQGSLNRMTKSIKGGIRVIRKDEGQSNNSWEGMSKTPKEDGVIYEHHYETRSFLPTIIWRFFKEPIAVTTRLMFVVWATSVRCRRSAGGRQEVFVRCWLSCLLPAVSTFSQSRGPGAILITSTSVSMASVE